MLLLYIKDKYMKKKIIQKENNKTTMSFPMLRKMATTKRLKDILKNHIESETIPSVRTAWIEYFFEIKNRKIQL
jgi:hypothetical protein